MNQWLSNFSIGTRRNLASVSPEVRNKVCGIVFRRWHISSIPQNIEAYPNGVLNREKHNSYDGAPPVGDAADATSTAAANPVRFLNGVEVFLQRLEFMQHAISLYLPARGRLQAISLFVALWWAEDGWVPQPMEKF